VHAAHGAGSRHPRRVGLDHTQDGVKTTQELDSGQLGPVLADRFGIVLGDADLAKLRAL
jgi:hypothetical protein